MKNQRLTTGLAAALAIVTALLFTISVQRSRASGSCSQKKHPEFTEYAVSEIFTGKVHPAILSTHIEKNHRTVIREGLEKGVNFAGHYVLVFWGCGAGCKQFVIVDAKTGAVYDPPFAEVYYHFPPSDLKFNWWCYSDLLTYSKDSRLLIVEGCPRGNQCGRTYFVSQDGLKQLDYDPDLLPDGKMAPF